MKKFFNRLGFRKMDEMEQHIAFKAQRNSFVFLLSVLVIWTFYESYQVLAHGTKLNIFPSMVLFASIIIRDVSSLILTHNAVKGDEEAKNASPLFKTIITWVVAALVTLAVAGAVAFSVIRA